MDLAQPVVVALLVAGALALGGLIVFRPWKWIQRKTRGHEVEVHVETDTQRMQIPAGVEAPAQYWFNGTPPAAPASASRGWSGHVWRAWARENGGEDVLTSVVQVTIQGGGDGPISVEAPELTNHKVVERAVDGAVYGPEGRGGNGIHSRRYIFTLDGSDVRRTYAGDPEERPAAFMLGKSETQRLLVVVRVLDHHRHLWTIDIPIIHAGVSKTLKVRADDSGTFITYGSHGAKVWMAVDGQWAEAHASE